MKMAWKTEKQEKKFLSVRLTSSSIPQTRDPIIFSWIYSKTTEYKSVFNFLYKTT